MTLPTRSVIHPVLCLALLAGCTSDPLAGTTDANSSASIASTDPPTTSTTSSTSATATSTSDSGGPTEACAPDPASIPLEEVSQRFAEALCEQKAACGCDGGFACVGTFQMDFDPLVAYAAEHGLQYDGDCAARTLVNLVTGRGCKPASESYKYPCEPCYVFQGDIPEGEACTPPGSPGFYKFINVCADPALCFDTCKDLGKTKLQLGDACWIDGQGPIGLCEDASCDILGSNTCVPFLAEGADCSVAGVCESDTSRANPA